jgi:hypothetical protein
MTQDGCCIEAQPQPAPGSSAPAALVMAACDATNARQQFVFEDLNGKPGRIRDQEGRCLKVKDCTHPH